MASNLIRIGASVLSVFLILNACNTIGQSSGKGEDKECLTIQELKAWCTEGGFCNGRYCCEGKTVKVTGYLDFINIFDKKHYPHLVYQKFRIIDGPDILKSSNPLKAYRESLEVVTIGRNAEALFEKLNSIRGLPLKRIIVRGKVKGFNAYTNKGFSRELYLEASPEGVTVQEPNKKGGDK